MTFRSNTMVHYQMIIPRQNAYNIINLLGRINLVHIVDISDPMNKPFHLQVKRCEQSLQKIDMMIKALKKNELQFEEYDEEEPQFIQRYNLLWSDECKNQGIDELKILDRIENQLNDYWTQYHDLTIREDKSKQMKANILQKMACFETINSFFGDNSLKRYSEEYYMSNAVDSSADKLLAGVSYMVGVVDAESEIKLERMIYRISRGFACVEIFDKFKFKGFKEFQSKVVLIIYPSGSQAMLERKLKRVLDLFCNHCYMLSELEHYNSGEQLKRLGADFQQAQMLLQVNAKQTYSLLNRVKGIDYIESWRTFIWKEKLIYENMNKMELRMQFINSEIYVCEDKVDKLAHLLSKIVPAPSLHELPIGLAPTGFNTNSYTQIPQQIVNTYGVPRYQQINPSIFTTVTFPFFFGVMFSDIVHGLVILSFGLYLILTHHHKKTGIIKIFSSLRYLIFMMGFFGCYCGFIYNDFIGMNINIFGSCYNPSQKSSSPSPKQDCVYTFGMDPIWGTSTNQLTFVNSLKMKLSVIIGVIHMILGIGIKAANAIYFKRKLDFYFEFIPQIIFMSVLFGYMDFLIIFKWCKDWSSDFKAAPSVTTTVMNIGLKMGATTKTTDGGSNMWGELGNTSQDMIQLIILLIAVLCVPIMLFPKPLIEINHNKKLKGKHPLALQGDMHDEMELENQQVAEVELQKIEEPSEIFVHQLIETIQFVLGAVSNTASYLRLWALSLAHSQLAKVFFEKTLKFGFGPKTFLAVPIMLIAFVLLSGITFGIIICMDSMQCFLHALRLHWVQFQNKFYKGDGYNFDPLSFKKNLTLRKNEA